MKNIKYIVFILSCLFVMLIPSMGMIVAPTNATTENKELSSLPQIKTEDGYNLDYLGELGDYFQDHFAFRQQLVSTNAKLYGKLFGYSTTDQVILGKNNWMYYSGTLDDYMAINVMSDRKLSNAVHNLKMIQDYVESRGSKFILTIAPNKNSIYDENMPYYYRKGVQENNYDKLLKKINEYDINYVDLFGEFENSDEILYFERDSHWTNKGAVLAYNKIMSNIRKNFETYENIPYIIKKDHLGDLTNMLYPLNSELENNVYYDKNWSFNYVNEVNDNMDNWIETENPKKKEVLLVYRDSFGESLLPFLAEEFNKAYFSRLVPYNLTNVDVYQPDYTIIERVERRIGAFAEQPAIMQVPQVENITDIQLLESNSTINLKSDGGYYVINGSIDNEIVDDELEIYVKITDENGKITTYEPFYISFENNEIYNDFGYAMYLDKNSIQTDKFDIDLIIKKANQYLNIKQIEWNN